MGGSKDYEEQNLSNGEAIAINFVYIVSVLELARKKATEEAGEGEMDSGIITLFSTFSLSFSAATSAPLEMKNPPEACEG